MKNYHLKALQYQVDSWNLSAYSFGVRGSIWVRTVLDLVSIDVIKPIFTEMQMVRGRDPNREEIAIDYQFRVNPMSLAEWKLCAQQQGLGIQEWCRQSLDYCSERIEDQEIRTSVSVSLGIAS